MLRPILLLLLSSLAYSCAYVLLKHQFPGLSKITLMFCYSGIILLISTILKTNALTTDIRWFDFDSSKQLLFVILFGVLFSLADFCSFKASEFAQITPVLQTSVFVLIPVFTGMLDYAVERKPMNLGQIVACMLITIGVVIFIMSEDTAK